MEDLSWPRLGIPAEHLSFVAEDRDAWRLQLELLPPRPPKDKRVQKIDWLIELATTGPMLRSRHSRLALISFPFFFALLKASTLKRVFFLTNNVRNSLSNYGFHILFCYQIPGISQTARQKYLYCLSFKFNLSIVLTVCRIQIRNVNDIIAITEKLNGDGRVTFFAS